MTELQLQRQLIISEQKNLRCSSQQRAREGIAAVVIHEMNSAEQAYLHYFISTFYYYMHDDIDAAN